MTDVKTPQATEPSFEARKKALIAQGAARRKDIGQSIDIVRDNLHADKLAKQAVNYVTNATYNTIANLLYLRSLRNGNFRKLLPLAASIYAIVTRRKLVKPVMKGTAAVAGLSGGLFLYWRHKQKQKAEAQAQAELLAYSETDKSAR